MEVNRPTAADYASQEALGAQVETETASKKTRELEKRVAVLENEVRGLFLILSHVVDDAQLSNFVFDDETGEVMYEPYL